MDKLEQCNPVLQTVFNIVLKDFDNTIICGHRTKEAQNEAFKKGNTQVSFPNSMHNKKPSLAVDALPYPVNWHDTKRMGYFAGHVVQTANILYLQGAIPFKIRWGGDWNKDTELKDNTFQDLAHFELYDPE